MFCFSPCALGKHGIRYLGYERRDLGGLHQLVPTTQQGDPEADRRDQTIPEIFSVQLVNESVGVNQQLIIIVRVGNSISYKTP